MASIENHRQLCEICSDNVVDVKNVCSWLQNLEKVERRVKLNRRSLAPAGLHQLVEQHDCVSDTNG